MPSASELYLMRIWKQLWGATGNKGDADAIPTIAPLNVGESWRVATLNNTGVGNNKLFQTPPLYEGQICWIWCEHTSGAVVGNRQLSVRIENALGVTIGILARAGVTQAASLTYKYLFAPSVADLAALRDTDYLTTPIPPTSFVTGGQSIRVLDNKGISALDTLVVYMQIAYRTI
jgi:hypothetical protein